MNHEINNDEMNYLMEDPWHGLYTREEINVKDLVHNTLYEFSRAAKERKIIITNAITNEDFTFGCFKEKETFFWQSETIILYATPFLDTEKNIMPFNITGDYDVDVYSGNVIFEITTKNILKIWQKYESICGCLINGFCRGY